MLPVNRESEVLLLICDHNSMRMTAQFCMPLDRCIHETMRSGAVVGMEEMTEQGMEGNNALAAEMRENI